MDKELERLRSAAVRMSLAGSHYAVMRERFVPFCKEWIRDLTPPPEDAGAPMTFDAARVDSLRGLCALMLELTEVEIPEILRVAEESCRAVIDAATPKD